MVVSPGKTTSIKKPFLGTELQRIIWPLEKFRKVSFQTWEDYVYILQCPLSGPVGHIEFSDFDLQCKLRLSSFSEL